MALACAAICSATACGKHQVVESTGWVRVDSENPRDIAPHVLAVGDKRSHVELRTERGWKRVGSFSFVGPLKKYAGGRRAVVRVIDERGPRLLWLAAGREPLELPDCGSLAVTDRGQAVSCIECDAQCEQLRIVRYGDPAVPPADMALNWPAEACGGRLRGSGERGDVAWFEPPADEAWPPTVRASCAQPVECVYLEVDAAARAVRVTGRRAESCP